MPLIIKNSKTTKDNAIIIFKSAEGNKEIEHKKDFSIIKINKNIVGVNVFGSSKYFEAIEGVHTLNKNQKEILKNNNINFNDDFIFYQVGEVIERKDHPKSNKLFVLKVKTTDNLQIVTNSLNSLVGTKVVVANVGATLPSGLLIKKSKVLGIESEGMLCGGETLNQEPTKGVLLVSGIVGEEFLI